MRSWIPAEDEQATHTILQRPCRPKETVNPLFRIPPLESYVPKPDNCRITATRPVMIVTDMDRAVDFYSKIGFTEVFRNDVVYSVLKMDGHFVHLGTRMDDGAGYSQAFLEMKGVDEYYAYCLRQEVEIHRELVDQFYGLRDFQLLDPDGNLLTFGEHLQAEHSEDDSSGT